MSEEEEFWWDSLMAARSLGRQVLQICWYRPGSLWILAYVAGGAANFQPQYVRHSYLLC